MYLVIHDINSAIRNIFSIICIVTESRFEYKITTSMKQYCLRLPLKNEKYCTSLKEKGVISTWNPTVVRRKMIPSLAKKQSLHHTDAVPGVPTLPDPAATNPSTPLKAYEPESKLSLVMRKPVFTLCEQQRRRSACASAQSDQHLCCSLPR